MNDTCLSSNAGRHSENLGTATFMIYNVIDMIVLFVRTASKYTHIIPLCFCVLSGKPYHVVRGTLEAHSKTLLTVWFIRRQAQSDY